jgi:hypothetical protein
MGTAGTRGWAWQLATVQAWCSVTVRPVRARMGGSHIRPAERRYWVCSGPSVVRFRSRVVPLRECRVLTRCFGDWCAPG